MRPWVLHGWHLSYFSGKVRAYLHYKGIEFIDQPMSLYTLAWAGRRRTGAVVMPLLVTPEGEWWQDSSEMIDRIEQRVSDYSVLPITPVQRVVSFLLEAWADEWWIPIAMHSRWNHAENYSLFEPDAGSALLPRSPRWLQNRAAGEIASRLRGYLEPVGIRPSQYETMDRWAEHQLDLFDAHFRAQTYLLGGRPTLGDFALFGPMYGHLGRDPWPAREWVASRPAVRTWINRLGMTRDRGPLVSDDSLPPTLMPILAAIANDFLPLVEGIAAQVWKFLPAWPQGKALPRSLDDVTARMGDAPFARLAMPYTLWMIQRVQDAWRALPSEAARRVQHHFDTFGGGRFLSLPLPRLKRRGLRVACVSDP